MTYTISDFGSMAIDRVRRDAYMRIINENAHGRRVLDLGCGTGIFTMAALDAGAEHVVAVDVHPATRVLPDVLRANGLAERWQVFFDDVRSLDIGVFDLILADLRGPTAFYGDGLEVMRYARDRLLAEQGLITPLRDDYHAALVSLPAWYERMQAPWHLGRYDWSQYADRVFSSPVQINAVSDRDLASDAANWAVIDYSADESLGVRHRGGTFKVPIIRDAVVHAIVCWFETWLSSDTAYNTKPSSHLPTYGRLLLPLTNPLQIRSGESANITVQCHRISSGWLWEWGVEYADSNVKMSSLNGLILDH